MCEVQSFNFTKYLPLFSAAVHDHPKPVVIVQWEMKEITILKYQIFILPLFVYRICGVSVGSEGQQTGMQLLQTARRPVYRSINGL